MRIEYPSGIDYPKTARTDIVYYCYFYYNIAILDYYTRLTRPLPLLILASSFSAPQRAISFQS